MTGCSCGGFIVNEEVSTRESGSSLDFGFLVGGVDGGDGGGAVWILSVGNGVTNGDIGTFLLSSMMFDVEGCNALVSCLSDTSFSLPVAVGNIIVVVLVLFLASNFSGGVTIGLVPRCKKVNATIIHMHI
jgi:hypothetical protein